MGHRSELEDRYTVRCRPKGHESIDPNKHPAQKYLKGTCKQCTNEKLSKVQRGLELTIGGRDFKVTDRAGSNAGIIVWLIDSNDDTTWVYLHEIEHLL